jgi:hypothetical protein
MSAGFVFRPVAYFVTDTTGDMAELPAASEAMQVSAWLPAESFLVFQLSLKG